MINAHFFKCCILILILVTTLQLPSYSQSSQDLQKRRDSLRKVMMQRAAAARKKMVLPPPVTGEVARYQANDHVIEIHPGGRVASLILDEVTYKKYLTEYYGGLKPALPDITKDVYAVFDDEFDYIAITYKDAPKRSAPGRHYPISNNVSGIGKPLFDYSATYASKGRLTSIVEISSYLFFEASLSHEIVHKWGISDAIPRESINEKAEVKPNGGHWGMTFHSRKAQLNSFESAGLIEKGNNTYQVDFKAYKDTTQLYADMELYLMGMIPLEEVEPFDAFTEITSFAFLEDGKREFVANKRTTYTPEMLREILGERIPGYKDSQKNFRMLTLVLTDSPLTEKVWRAVDERAYRNGLAGDNKYGGRNFWEGTGGRGTMQTGGLKPKEGMEKIN